jgi:hypothetical protein
MVPVRHDKLVAIVPLSPDSLGRLSDLGDLFVLRRDPRVEDVLEEDRDLRTGLAASSCGTRHDVYQAVSLQCLAYADALAHREAGDLLLHAVGQAEAPAAMQRVHEEALVRP